LIKNHLHTCNTGKSYEAFFLEKFGRIETIYFQGTYDVTYRVITNRGYISDLKLDTTSDFYFIIGVNSVTKKVLNGNSGNVYFAFINAKNATLENFKIYGYTAFGNSQEANLANGHFVGAVTWASATNLKIKNVVFDSTITIDDDYMKLNDCKVAGVTTLNSGAEYNVLTGNTLTGGTTNNSGNSTNEFNNNI